MKIKTQKDKKIVAVANIFAEFYLLLWYNLGTLLGRLTVGQRTLDPFILVRIQAQQQKF